MPPSRLTASIFMPGVLVGMQMVALHPCTPLCFSTWDAVTQPCKTDDLATQFSSTLCNLHGDKGFWASQHPRQGLTSLDAASDTPWAWLPAEDVITPFSRCSAVKLAILL